MKLSLQHLITIGFGFALLLILSISLFAWRSEYENEKATYWVGHTHDVLTELGSLLASANDSETSIQGFIITGEASYLDAYQGYRDTVDHEFQALLRLTVDNPHQQARLASLKPLLDIRASQLNKKVELRRRQGFEAAAKALVADKDSQKRIRLVIRGLQQAERDLLVQRLAQATASSRLVRILIVAGCLLASGFIAIALAIVRRDFARRLRAETALRDNEESLNITLHSIGDAVLAVDTGLRITRINHAAARLTGWPQAEAMGRPVDEVFRIINEETRRPAVIPVEKVLQTGEVQGLANHTLLIARDGSECPIADSAAPICDAEGRVRGVVLVFRDVSQERAADLALRNKEAETRTILNNLIDGVITIDTRGTVCSANSSVARILGYSPEEIIGRNVSMLMPEPHCSHHDVYLKHYLRTGERRIIGIGREVEGRHKDGRLIPLDLSVSEYELQGERMFAGSLRDIRERKQYIADLLQSRAEAEQANHAKSAFLAAMSHEIRTPMNGVIGMVDVLVHGHLTEHQAELVSTIRESGTNLLSIIDDILDFSKIEASRLEIERTPVCVADLLESLAVSLIPVAGQRGADIQLFISPEIPARVLTDDIRLRQVLNNLVGNAIKFSSGQPGKRGRISVRAEVAQADPLRLAFRIADNGIGMTAESLKNLFTPFTQAEVSTTRRFGGTGLGLAICKRLVDMMEGEITVESTSGVGSTFTVNLPLERAPEQPMPSLPDLNGIDCILVNEGCLAANDISIYLEYAGARVYLESDASAAAHKAADLTGPVVVIRDSEHTRTVPDGDYAALQKVGHLLITRNYPGARLEVSGAAILDGGVLRRQALLRAVAVAAGRALPEIVHDVGGDAAMRLPETPSLTVAEARAQGRLVLVADDDDINRKVILEQLGLLGYGAEVAQDGEEALRMWRNGEYALLLTDLHMPKMDGYTLAGSIRREEVPPGRLPILAITANALRGEASRALAAGMDDYLTKPVQLRVLKDVLDKWLPQQSGAALFSSQTEETQGTRAAAVMDVEVLKGLVGDDEAVVERFLSVFLASAGNMAEELQIAFTLGDLQQAAAVVHKFKSASRSVGALALGDLCTQLESAAMAGDNAAFTHYMLLFNKAFDAVKTQISEYLTRQ